MGIIPRVAASLQSLFGAMAEDVAEANSGVLRRRKFTTATLAKTFLFGFLAHPRATDEQLAQTAGLFGVHVTTQAVEQRFTLQLAAFLEALFRSSPARRRGNPWGPRRERVIPDRVRPAYGAWLRGPLPQAGQNAVMEGRPRDRARLRHPLESGRVE